MTKPSAGALQAAERLLAECEAHSEGLAPRYCARIIDEETGLLEMLEAENQRDKLIMAVGNKYLGESRFDTALRLIRIAQESTLGATADNPQE